MWTAVGRTEVHHVYRISAVTAVQRLRRYVAVQGAIQKTIIDNGVVRSVEQVNTVRIPSAYSGMAALENMD